MLSCLAPRRRDRQSGGETIGPLREHLIEDMTVIVRSSIRKAAYLHGA
jgi:hypothetical protein